MADLTGMLQAAAGSAGGGGPTIQEVFNTSLYTGTGTSVTVNNGIDLAGEGGALIIKCRSLNTTDNILFSTGQTSKYGIKTNRTDATANYGDAGAVFSSTGFSIPNAGGFDGTNQSTQSYVSWTFRKAPKFFDAVAYTGNGVAGRTVAHNLGSVPGCIMVKRISTSSNWQVYHRANTAEPETDYLILNSTSGTADSATRWNDTAPTDSVFSLGTDSDVNGSGSSYIAYLFAHDAGGFGAGEAENVITCGSYVGNESATGPIVTLGYEPQWLMIKRVDQFTTANWNVWDSKRDPSNPRPTVIALNLDEDELAGYNVDFNSTGFQIKGTNQQFNAASGDYIYIAIRADMV